jgi:uncharacterized protein (TIGR02145 family)
LIVKLNAARQNLLKTKFDTALGILEAFKDLVEDLVLEEKISSGIGEELVKLPEAIIEVFTHQCGNPYIDWRDGNSYNTVQIGNQCWFSENLNFETDYSFYYDNNSENGETYGRLYSWGAANAACPIGWHLPSDGEWTILTDYLIENGYGYGGSGEDIGKSLASKSEWGESPVPGDVGNDIETNNSSGFNALPGGSYDILLGFTFLSRKSYFWSSTTGAGFAYYRRLDFSEPSIFRSYSDRINGFSVRCLKSE